MNDIQKKTIRELRASGQGIQRIAETLGISPNTVKSHCQRNGLTGRKALADEKSKQKDTCKQCGAALPQRAHSKKRIFCSSECRVRWWSKNRSQSAGAATVVKHCEQCGRPFRSAASAKRKFCGYACFSAARTREDTT